MNFAAIGEMSGWVLAAFIALLWLVFTIACVIVGAIAAFIRFCLEIAVGEPEPPLELVDCVELPPSYEPAEVAVLRPTQTRGTAGVSSLNSPAVVKLFGGHRRRQIFGGRA